jgi:exodeoxyribonuclease-3
MSVYVPNGGEINSDKFKMKLDFLRSLRLYLKKLESSDENIIIGGDFNVAPFDIDVHAPEHLQHTTCFTEEERILMRSILNDKWLDLYRLQYPNKNEYSWWDYRSRAFEHNQGMRIDLILGNSKASDRLSDFIMDSEERAKEKPSDHIPIMACFQ